MILVASALASTGTLAPVFFLVSITKYLYDMWGEIGLCGKEDNFLSVFFNTGPILLKNRRHKNNSITHYIVGKKYNEQNYATYFLGKISQIINVELYL